MTALAILLVWVLTTLIALVVWSLIRWAVPKLTRRYKRVGAHRPDQAPGSVAQQMWEVSDEATW